MADSATARRPRKTVAVWAAIILIVLAALGGWWWTQRSGSAAGAASSGGKGGGQGAAMAVGVAPTVQQNAPLQIQALGTVTAARTVTVHTQVSGPLLGVYFEEGQAVGKGQLLAEIDPRPMQASLLQAEGQLMRDQALLANARTDLARYQQLQSQDSIAGQTVDTQTALVKQYEGTVKLDQGQVDSAKVNLSYTRIASPVAGVAGLRQIDPGNVVNTTDSNGIVVITVVQPIDVTFALPEGSMERLRQARETTPKLKAEAWNRDNSSKVADGILLAVDNQINTATGTYNLKARFQNQDQKLFPNQFVNIKLDLGAVSNAIMVPTAAVQMGKVGTFVYLVNANHTVSVNAVTTGETSGSNTIIAQGLQAGQTVVVDGLDKLRDGAQIVPVDRNAQVAGTAAAPAAGAVAPVTAASTATTPPAGATGAGAR